MSGRIYAAVALTALVLSACASNAIPSSTSDDTILEPGREISIVTSDNLQLEGRVFGVGSKIVVLAHMQPADMTSWFDFARVLADEGFTAITFNFRGYGGSEGDPGDFDVETDVRAAVDAASARGAARIYVIGASMGGTGAVAASRSSDIAGTITLSAPDQFAGVDAVASAQFVKSPLLLIAADEDASAADDALAIAAAAPGDAEVAVLSGAQHGTNLFAEHGEEITELILDFLRAN